MKRTSIATLLIGIAFVALPALATESNTLMIFSFQPGGAAFIGSFNSSGVIHEAGTAESTVNLDRSTGILTAQKVIHLSGGDIRMSVQGPLDMTNGPASVTLTGKWQLTGGSGVYSGITGRGTCVVVGDLVAGRFSGAYQGKVKLAGDKDDGD